MQPRSDEPDADSLAVAMVPPAVAGRSRVGGLAVALVIALQVAVPTVALLLPPPQRFGFQMYSGLGGIVITVFGEGGEERELDDTENLVAKLRPEVDWLLNLPEAVCETDASATRVRVGQSGRERTVVCD